MYLYLADRTRLVESHHDLRATATVDTLTKEPVFAATLRHTHSALSAARDDLLEAARELGRELSETDAVRANLEAIDALAAEVWRWVQRQLEHALLVWEPGAPQPGPRELTRRERLLGQVFPATVRQLDRVGFDRRREHLAAAVAGLERGELAPLVREVGAEGLIDRLRAAAEALSGALDAVNRERAEDTEARNALTAARLAFDQRHAAHTQAVLLALVDAGRPDDAPRYLLSRDTAYRARRKARRPLAEEPTIEVVEPDVRVEPPREDPKAPA